MKLQINTKFNNTMKNAYRQYMASRACYLEDLYKNPSIYKYRAFKYLEHLSIEHGGDLYLWGANCMSFSAGFVYEDGEDVCFVYFTKDNTRVCRLRGINDSWDMAEWGF